MIQEQVVVVSAGGVVVVVMVVDAVVNAVVERIAVESKTRIERLIERRQRSVI